MSANLNLQELSRPEYHLKPDKKHANQDKNGLKSFKKPSISNNIYNSGFNSSPHDTYGIPLVRNRVKNPQNERSCSSSKSERSPKL